MGWGGEGGGGWWKGAGWWGVVEGAGWWGVFLIKAGIRKFYPCHLVVRDLRLETKGSILDVI